MIAMESCLQWASPSPKIGLWRFLERGTEGVRIFRMELPEHKAAPRFVITDIAKILVKLALLVLPGWRVGGFVFNLIEYPQKFVGARKPRPCEACIALIGQ